MNPRVAGAALMAVGVAVLSVSIASVTGATASSSATPAPPSASPGGTASKSAPPADPTVLKAGQIGPMLTALRGDTAFKGLIASQNTDVWGLYPKLWTKSDGTVIGATIEFTLSQPINVPSGYPAVFPAATSTGYTVQNSPTGATGVKFLTVWFDGRTSTPTVAGYAPATAAPPNWIANPTPAPTTSSWHD